MKRCPRCSAENRDAAAYCSTCGSRLDAPAPQAGAPERTQPVRPVPPPPPGAAAYHAPGESGQGDTQPFAPQGGQGQSTAPSPSSTQPVPASYRPSAPPSSAPPSSAPLPSAPPPGYGPGGQAYPPQSPYGQAPGGPAYGSPPGGPPYYGGPAASPPPPARPGGFLSGGRFWTLLIGALVLTLLCACGLAAWTMTSAAGTGIANLGDQIATQAAGVLGPAATEVPPTPELPAEPTPWPTFTPGPPPTETPNPAPTETEPAPTATVPAEPTAAPDETQQAVTERLLSPACSAALDEMQRYSGELTSSPLRVLEPEWREGFNRALESMNAACGTVDAASPVPGRLSEARQNLALANQSFDEATRLFGEGVAELNPSKLLEAGQKIQQAREYLGKAITALREIGQ